MIGNATSITASTLIAAAYHNTAGTSTKRFTEIRSREHDHAFPDPASLQHELLVRVGMVAEPEASKPRERDSPVARSRRVPKGFGFRTALLLLADRLRVLSKNMGGSNGLQIGRCLDKQDYLQPQLLTSEKPCRTDAEF